MGPGVNLYLTAASLLLCDVRVSRSPATSILHATSPVLVMRSTRSARKASG